MPPRLGFLFLGLLLSAASCDRRPSYAEFQARAWDTECSADQECVLLSVPCDHCGVLRAVSSGEASQYREVSATVDCADYTLDREVDCGSRAHMEPACSAGQCTARPAAPPAVLPIAPPEPQPPSVCDGLRARAAALLATPAAGCESDEDCGCYPGFVDCGGVRDAASASAFGAIAAEGQAADCGYVDETGSQFNCAPWQCIPVCRNGMCQRGQRP